MSTLCQEMKTHLNQKVGFEGTPKLGPYWKSQPATYKPQGEWDRVAEQMMIKFSESGHPVFRATSPLSRGMLKSKGGGNLSVHFCADQGKIETVFRTIVSVNQLSFYGAVSDLCEECKTCHVRTDLLWQDNLTHCLCQV